MEAANPTSDALTVLLVDDDNQMLRTIADILRFRGYTTVPAQSGRAGLSLVEAMDVGPAIALVDLRLPDMDGIELIGRLHAISAMTQVVILTGNASVDSAVRALREQSYDYLIKPVAPEQLLNSIDRAGDRWQRRNAEAALAESESRLRRVFDCVSDGLFVTDNRGRITDANSAAAALTNLDITGLRSRTVGDLLRPLDSPALDRTSANANPLPAQGEYRLARDDGTTRTVDVRTSGLTSDLSVFTVRDLTVQRGLEEQLHHAQKMDAIGRLAGGIAHDFNNVLTAILAYGELLTARLASTPDGGDEAVQIVKAARRAAGLTAQLLAFGRKTVLEPRVVDVAAVISDLEKMLERLIGGDVKLVTHSDAGIRSVRADPGQIGQVVMNLAVNARDAMPRGGTLSINTSSVVIEQERPHAHGVVPPGSYVLIEVSDTGTGMEVSTVARMFEPFFTTKGVGKGTGLGLSTTYGIIASAGGHIEVDTVLGRGTTIRVYLPRVDDVATQQLKLAPASRPATKPSGTLLLVEDEKAIRDVMTRGLRSAGYVVLAATDGREALEIAAAHQSSIELVVADISLPGMSGPELVRQLRVTRPGLAVLYMSGYTRDTDGLMEIGGRDANLLQKPFNTKELLAKVAACATRS